MTYPFEDALLDTSVVVKWFVPEEDSEIAIRIQDAYLRGELRLHVPDILLMELGNALRYSGLLDEERIVWDLQTIPDLGVGIIAFDIEILKSSVALSLERNIAVYDAYFLALARAMEIPLITADRKMLSRLTEKDGAVNLTEI